MREFTDGSTAIVRGALAAGCTFFAGYPITPASPILTMMMREVPISGGVAIQGEDEIASIGMCVGAAMAGSRAMTATSGPGISLFSETIGLAIIGEVPLVIVDVQRMGPSTGGATTVGQGDVLFVRWGTSGGYPIITLAPSTIPECYTLTCKAFDLAERFRCPVFLLTDKELNLTMGTVDPDSYVAASVRERPGPRTGPTPDRPYRYDPADGVPPMRHFGEKDILRFTGSTHDENAFITKHAPTVGALNRHLHAKIMAHREEIELVNADLEPGADTLLISFGVTAGAMREAVGNARKKGKKVSALTILSLWPVPDMAIAWALSSVKHVVVAELNPGLYTREIERLADNVDLENLNRTDGELITPEQFEEMIR